MGDVDEALSRAFARRPIPGLPGEVPPPPHGSRSPRGIEGRGVEQGRRRAVELDRQRSGEPSSRIASRGLSRSAPAVEGPWGVGWEWANGPGLQLDWPEVVLVLEREVGERFERLADTLVEGRDRQGLRIVLATSCHRAEGRTTLVLALARALARRPGRTILVDGDLTGPRLARTLGIGPGVGLDDVVEQSHAVEDAVLEAADDHLWIAPLRAPVAAPRDFYASPRWSLVMARLRREFDLVVIDGGPLFLGPGAAMVPRGVDAALLVRNRRLTGDPALLRARAALEAGGVPLLGIAETFA